VSVLSTKAGSGFAIYQCPEGFPRAFGLPAALLRLTIFLLAASETHQTIRRGKACVNFYWRFIMIIRTLLAAVVAAAALLTATGCAVGRGQQTVGSYIDDATITTQIKARFADNTQVAATSISVETLNGTVLLSGFAKNATEKTMAESIARGVNGVRSVKNEIVVRP